MERYTHGEELAAGLLRPYRDAGLRERQPVPGVAGCCGAGVRTRRPRGGEAASLPLPLQRYSSVPSMVTAARRPR